LDQFTPEERDAIWRLQELGDFPLPLVVHAFLATGKNAASARNLLLGVR
jgi:hypothetical protein